MTCSSEEEIMGFMEDYLKELIELIEFCKKEKIKPHFSVEENGYVLSLRKIVKNEKKKL